MNWSTPAAFGLLGLFVPLVLLYVLRVQAKRQRVGSLFLWQQVQRQEEAQRPWQRLRRHRSLILQCLALLALVLGAAGPRWDSETGKDAHLALIIDTSASMSQRDLNNTTAMAKAIAAAEGLIADLRPGTDVLLIDAGSQAHIASPASQDKQQLVQALQSLRPRHEAGSINESILLATGQLQQRAGRRRIVVISDGQLAQPVQVRNTIPVDFVLVAKATENTAIVSTEVMLGQDAVTQRATLRVLCQVQNFTKNAREMFVTMRRPGSRQTLASARDVVAAGAQSVFELRYDRLATAYGEPVILELQPNDAMAVDNTVYIRVPNDPTLNVTFAGKRKLPWLERAVASAPLVRVHRSESPRARISQMQERGGLLIAAGYCPSAELGAHQLIVAPAAGRCHGITIGPATSNHRITSWRRTDPRLRYVQAIVDDRIATASLLSGVEDERELIQSSGGTLVADASSQRFQRTVLGFFPHDSVWPLDNSFVIFVRNILEESRSSVSRRSHVEAGPGGVVRASLPAGVKEFVLETLDSAPRKRRSRHGFAILAERRTTGIYRWRWSEQGGGREAAVINLHAAAESDLRRAPPTADGLRVRSAASTSTLRSRVSLEWCLALLALIFLVVDRLDKRLNTIPQPANSRSRTKTASPSARQR